MLEVLSQISDLEMLKEIKDSLSCYNLCERENSFDETYRETKFFSFEKLSENYTSKIYVSDWFETLARSSPYFLQGLDSVLTVNF